MAVRRAVSKPPPVLDAVLVRIETLLAESSSRTAGKQRLNAMQCIACFASTPFSSASSSGGMRARKPPPREPSDGHGTSLPFYPSRSAHHSRHAARTRAKTTNSGFRDGHMSCKGQPTPMRGFPLLLGKKKAALMTACLRQNLSEL